MMGRLLKRAVFAIALAFVVLIPVEFVAQLFHFARYGTIYSPSGLHAFAERSSSADLPLAESNGIPARRVLHPYLGYSMDRRETRGMAGDIDPVQVREAGKFIVGVTGGSVANQVCSALDEALTHEFARNAKPVEVLVVCLAIDGFKQPQQLIAINYLLAIGAEFDAVVNIDGFNDIVLPIIDNYERGIYPFYPRSWQSFANSRASQATMFGVGEIAVLRREQDRRISDAQTSPLGRSAIVGLYSISVLTEESSRIAQIQRALIAESIDLSFESQGPFEKYDDVAHVYALAADVWARSSILMKGILSEVETPYFHVLQPNQYVSGSKVLSENERKIVLAVEHPYAKLATLGYPYLFEASRKIVDAKVSFFDQTPVFRDITDDVYHDACCHVNKFGKKLMAREISAWMVSQLP